MLSFKTFLTENKIDWLKSNVGEISTHHDVNAIHHEPGAIIDHFAEHDPHPKKAYTPWMISRYKNADFRQEDAPRVGEALRNFDRYKGRLEKKDINQYGRLHDVETAVEPHLGQVASNKEAKRQTKLEGADEVHNANGLRVLKIKTHDAAKLYGHGTKWCTTMKDPRYYNMYTKKGPLYILNTSDGRKHQVHFESDQFNDETDRNIGLHGLATKYPEIRNVKDFAGKHFSLDRPETINSHIASGGVYRGNDGRRFISADAKSSNPILTAKTLEAAYRHHSQNDQSEQVDQILQHPNAPEHLKTDAAEKIANGKIYNNLIDSDGKNSRHFLQPHHLERAYEIHKANIQSNPGTTPSVIRSIARHPNAPFNVINDAIPHIVDANDQKIIGSNPTLTSDQISTLYERHGSNKDNSHLNIGLASHPNAHPDTLHEMAHNWKSDIATASAALENPRTRPETYESLIGASPSVDMMLTDSPRTPDHVLRKLTEHSHPFVAMSAKTALKNRA